MVEIKNLSEQAMIGYYAENLDEVMVNQGLMLDDYTSFYVVALLVRMTQTKKLFSPYKDETSLDKKPLTFVLKDALKGDSIEKYFKLKTIGDFTLTMSGFFRPYLERERRPNLVKFYMTLGRGAYSSLSDLVLHSKNEPDEVFKNLSVNFSYIRECLEELSVKTAPDNNLATLGMYDRWMRYGQEYIRQELIKRDIPIPDKRLLH